MAKKLVYLTGPMAGLPNNNREQFEKAMRLLNEQFQYVSIVPVPDDGVSVTPEQFARDNAANMLMNCREVITMPDWESSPGAKRDVEVARLFDIPVTPISKYLPSEPFKNLH